MNKTPDNKNTSEVKDQTPERKPNDTNGMLFSSVIKIFDPNTKEVLVHKRGDN
jgi:hypothetical protein